MAAYSNPDRAVGNGVIDAEHDVVIATAPLYAFDKWAPRWLAAPEDYVAPDVEGFRARLPERYRGLLVGPVHSAVNGFLTWIFTPDGHYEHCEVEVAEVDALRREFLALWSFRYADGSSPFQVVHVRYGGERPPGYRTSIEYSQV